MEHGNISPSIGSGISFHFFVLFYHNKRNLVGGLRMDRWFLSSENLSTLPMAILDIRFNTGCFDHMEWKETIITHIHIVTGLLLWLLRCFLHSFRADFHRFRGPSPANKRSPLQHRLALVLPRTVPVVRWRRCNFYDNQNNQEKTEEEEVTQSPVAYCASHDETPNTKRELVTRIWPNNALTRGSYQCLS